MSQQQQQHQYQTQQSLLQIDSNSSPPPNDEHNDNDADNSDNSDSQLIHLIPDVTSAALHEQTETERINDTNKNDTVTGAVTSDGSSSGSGVSSSVSGVSGVSSGGVISSSTGDADASAGSVGGASSSGNASHQQHFHSKQAKRLENDQNDQQNEEVEKEAVGKKEDKQDQVEVEEENENEDEDKDDHHDHDDDDDDDDDDDESGEDSWDVDSSSRSISSTSTPSSSSTSTGASQSNSLTRTIFIWSTMVALVSFLVYLRFYDSSLLLENDMELESMRPPESTLDYYSLLGISRNANKREITKSYRTLALQYHPDKNPGCVDCSVKFAEITKAYQTLSNPTQRTIYDQIEVSYEPLHSEAIELTSQNIGQLVYESDQIWVIEIYSEWHKSCIHFSQHWEEAISRLGSFVQFGRLHAFNEQLLVRQLPVSFRAVPSVVTFVNGRFTQSKLFSGSMRNTLAQLLKFIEQQYPNSIVPVKITKDAKVEAIQTFFTSTSTDELQFAQVKMLYFPDPSKVTKPPSLLLKSIARHYRHNFVFGQIEMDPSSADQYSSFVSGVTSRYPRQSQLPALLYQVPGQPMRWYTGRMKRDILSKFIGNLQRTLVPSIDSTFYRVHCVTTDQYCIALVICGQMNFTSQTTIRKQFTQLAAADQSHFALPLPLQFVTIDANAQTEFQPICATIQQQHKQMKEKEKVSNVEDNGAPHPHPSDAHLAFDWKVVAIVEHASAMLLSDLSDATLLRNETEHLSAWIATAIGSYNSNSHSATPMRTFPVLPIPSIPLSHSVADVWTIRVMGQTVHISMHVTYACIIVLTFITAWPIIRNHLSTFAFLLFVSTLVFPAMDFYKRLTGTMEKI